jgi:lipoprotein-releasing system permease protein
MRSNCFYNYIFLLPTANCKLLNLPFFIAKRYLVSKKSHNAINIISGISVAGVCIGTMALVIVLSAFNGLSELVESLYNTFDADVEITAKQGKTFVLTSGQTLALKNIDGVAYFVEVVEGNALLKLEDKQCVATIKGVSDGFRRMNGFDSLIHEGTFNIQKSNIVFGRGISYRLQSGPGDGFMPVSVYAPKRGNISTFDEEGGLNELKVYPAGIFTINDEFDDKYVLMNIENARRLFDYKNEVTAVELGLAPNANAGEVLRQIKKMLGSGFEVRDRQQQNALLYKTLKSEKLWTFIILVFILLIATFNVIGSLTMLIIEKQKDIGILYNIGADIGLIRNIFLVEGILITLIGAILGLLLGILICWIQMQFSVIKFTEGYVVDAYPIKFELTDFAAILGVVLFIGFLAAWYPVRIFTKRHLKLQATI